jgi:predicted methyltransferase MtxX (methanogen marker protein 4)
MPEHAAALRATCEGSGFNIEGGRAAHRFSCHSDVGDNNSRVDGQRIQDRIRMMLAASTFNETCDEVRLLSRRPGGRAGDLGVARPGAIACFRQPR